MTMLMSMVLVLVLVLVCNHPLSKSNFHLTSSISVSSRLSSIQPTKHTFLSTPPPPHIYIFSKKKSNQISNNLSSRTSNIKKIYIILKK